MDLGGIKSSKDIEIALVGNPNVGKSTLFNQLTGLNQSVGNWPGKTVEIAKGKLVFRGFRINVVDLPGIYSLSSYSEEEVVARDYLLSGSSDVIINVVDATALERNLYLTLQLLEMRVRVVVAVNFLEDAKAKGIELDLKALSRELGVPVVAINAFSGVGVAELVDAALAQSEAPPPERARYGKEVERRIAEISSAIRSTDFSIPSSIDPEWVAIKLLEGDPIMKDRYPKLSFLENRLKAIKNELEVVHGEESSVIIASERYSVTHRLVSSSSRMHSSPIGTIGDRVEAFITHRIFGYLSLLLVLGGAFYLIFALGGLISEVLDDFFASIIGAARSYLAAAGVDTAVSSMVLDGVLFGVGAAASIVLSYIFSFYLVLSLLEDTGYLPRAAFLLDSLMHKVGLHGKAFIPMLLGYGCSVPACISCRIMETKKERFMLGALVVLIPCSARSVIILGVTAQYLGFFAAAGIYLLDILVVLGLGRLLYRIMPGESVGLLMEMPRLRIFKPSLVLKKTWIRTKDFLVLGLPLIVAGSVLVESLRVFGVLEPLISAFSPFTVGLLGLPVATGVALIFGILRKEMALVMLATYVGTIDFATFMSPLQMIVFTVFMVLYVPCIATIAALLKEYKAKGAALIICMDVAVATLVALATRAALSLFL